MSMTTNNQALQRNYNIRVEVTKEKRDEEPQPNIMPFAHRMRLNGEIHLNYIRSGHKKYEARVYDKSKIVGKLKKNDRLSLLDPTSGQTVLCEITSFKVYKCFGSMLESVGLLNCLPHLKSCVPFYSDEELINKGVNFYQSFPDFKKARNWGVAAIGLNYLGDL